MSWITQLYETYEQCEKVPEFINLKAKTPLIPIYHTTQRAQVEVVINGEGKFLRASVINKDDQPTIIPCTEDSDARSSGPVAHPLCDYLKYVAGDLFKFSDSKAAKKSYQEFEKYITFLEQWVNAASHPKLSAIYRYVKKENIVQDLINYKIIPLNESGKILVKWKGNKEDKPKIYSAITSGNSPESVLVRWKVETPNIPESATWLDRSLMNSWIEFYGKDTTKEWLKMNRGFCSITGDNNGWMVKKYPAKILYSGDGAKLISANDASGYTFRGRFTDKNGKQAFDVSSDVVQKAHAALRWLIQRQSYKNDKQVFVAWAKAGIDIPDPFSNTHQLFGMDVESENSSQSIGDVGQAFAHKLSKQIAGYHSKLGATEQIIIMGLDSATPGRMAITYYRELTGSDFLERIENWHKSVSWHQNYSKDVKYIGAPSPKDIAEAAYGQRIDDKLRKATVERLLPCIIDGTAIPQDLITSCHNRLCNRVGMEAWEWEKTLGITCALVRGSQKERSYKMALETDRTTRDYLYGRLLAIADYLEYSALDKGNKRPTSATRLMHQFSMHPYKTWKNIELSLTSYKPRIHPGLLIKLDNLIDDVMDKFSSDDFINPSPLSSEFLLAFHSQRKDLWKKSESKDKTENITEELGA